MNTGYGFVVGGCRRARAAIEDEIRRAVYLEFKDRLYVGSFWKRLLAHRGMEREVQRRLERRAPAAALY